MRFYDAIPIAVLSSCAAHAYVCILRAPVYVASYVTHRKLRTCLSAYLSVCLSVCLHSAPPRCLSRRDEDEASANNDVDVKRPTTAAAATEAMYRLMCFFKGAFCSRYFLPRKIEQSGSGGLFSHPTARNRSGRSGLNESSLFPAKSDVLFD